MKKITATLILLLTTTISYAKPFMHLKAGFSKPKMDVTGYFKTDGKTYTLDGTFGLKGTEKTHFYIDIGLPILPNFKFESLPFEHYGKNVVKIPVDTGIFGIKFSAYDKVTSKVVFNQNNDFIIYYDLDFPYINPKLGFAVKFISGYLYAKAERFNQEERNDVETLLPLLYVGNETNIPFIPFLFDLALDLELKGIAFYNSFFLDLKAMGKLKLTTFREIGIIYAGMGYRYWHLVLKKLPDGSESDPEMNIEWEGTYLELGIEF
ncbi:MAG: hypothetical protein GXO22_05265 [Aquificae bacterium]|nr:hypothetical protein [Aquificota bacterium]